MNNNNSMTFWELINEYYIYIPQLQREYAQGRKDENIKQIREALISEFYDSLLTNKNLVLNFIYGENTDNCFTPIDGQQRLTSLFLLHWYFFSRCDYSEGLLKLKNFSYCTRDTSKRFCEKICETKINFSSLPISKEISDSYWFSGNFMSDSTIKSMLTVINSIHTKFSSINDTQIHDIKNLLISSDCPITFLWLPMDEFKSTNDLYIKMNARGKLLSDFEIFKAKLQESEILNWAYGDNFTDKNRVDYISKFNNKYSELFFKYFDFQYDDAMMAFILSIIRDDYFANLSIHNKISQKDYRDKYKEMDKMDGNAFYRFLINNAIWKENNIDQKAIIANSIKKISHLLDLFYTAGDLTIQNSFSKEYYNEQNIFSKKALEMTYSDRVSRYAIYEYMNKFGYPSDTKEINAYTMWKRIVYNLNTNTNLGGRPEDTCEAMAVFTQLLKSIQNNTEYDVLTAIINYTGNSTAEMKYQFTEEQEKARLFISNPLFKDLILTAEDYYIDGQISFLLDCSKNTDGNYDINKFQNFFEISKNIFDKNKKNIKKCKKELLDKALLCMPDISSNHIGHLRKQSNSTTSWGFCLGDYNNFLTNHEPDDIIKNRRNILINLFNNINPNITINENLKQIIEKTDFQTFSSEDLWKIYFIKYDLFDIKLGKYSFSNCIHIGKDNTEVFLLIGTTIRSYSMELHTYLLANELLKHGGNKNFLSYKLETASDTLDADDFPLRYFEYKGIKTGFLNASKKYILKFPNGSIQKMNKTDALKTLNSF